MITYNSQTKCYMSSLLGDVHYFSGFSTKELGDGTEPSNLTAFLHNNSISYKKIIRPKQIHSANVSVIDSKVYNQKEKVIRIDDTDGVVTAESDLFLAVVTADCVPIIFMEKQTGVIGVSHQGWRGALNRLPIHMIEKMITVGAKKENIRAAIGPAIGACCYDISEDRYQTFTHEFDSYLDKVFEKRSGRWYMNLALLNYLLLLEAGVMQNQIDFFPFCTECNEEKFYSYRREGKQLAGELFSFILKKSATIGNI